MKKLLGMLLIICIITSLAGCDLFFGAYEKISAEELKQMMDDEEIFVILDIRSEMEYDRGHIEGAINIPAEELEERAEEMIQSKSTPIIVYCKNGTRTGKAIRTLEKLGYTRVKSLGGISDWPYETVKS